MDVNVYVETCMDMDVDVETWMCVYGCECIWF